MCIFNKKETISKRTVTKMINEMLQQEKLVTSKVDNYAKVGNAVFSTTIMNIAFKYGIKDI